MKKELIHLGKQDDDYYGFDAGLRVYSVLAGGGNTTSISSLPFPIASPRAANHCPNITDMHELLVQEDAARARYSLTSLR